MPRAVIPRATSFSEILSHKYVTLELLPVQALLMHSTIGASRRPTFTLPFRARWSNHDKLPFARYHYLGHLSTGIETTKQWTFNSCTEILI